MMGDADLLGRLQHEAFDLILVDPNEICGFVLAHVLGVPHAMFSTGLWFPAEIGAPAPLSYVPEFNSELTDEMGLWQRLKNGAFYIVSRIGTRWLIFPRYDRILAQHNTVPALPMATIIEKSAVFMLCTDLALEFPRPTLPHVVFVGGVLTRPAQLLPQVFSEWAKASGPNGFVLVSFGAGIKHLSNELTNTFAGALAQLPYQVIWRYFGKSPKNLGNNTWLVEWVPQNDLLGHPNARAFISHGGLNGIYEAVYHSVPVVGLPIFGDHYDTMTRVHAKGMGIKLDWRRLTEQKLSHTIITVASDSRYKEKAVQLSRIYRDQEHPVKRAVHWIEYVLRHDGAPHLRPRVYDLSFYTYFFLDLLAIGVFFGLFLGWVVLVFLRWRSLRAPDRLQASSACCIGDGGQTGHAFRQKLD
uniref:UDP-glucuronosyltransferase n=1 Tax=Eptatretus burgeri TaxID=7764 RepID=A0A8C4QFP6_EPTBU